VIVSEDVQLGYDVGEMIARLVSNTKQDFGN